MQSLCLYTSWLGSMSLNHDSVDMEKHDGTRSLTFVVDDVSGLVLHSSIFSIKDSKSAYVSHGGFSDISYWLNSNILVSSEDNTTLQKS